ncbi:hypothetical protein CCO02nite_27950 [Cellulomonas composti]|uniref:Uncharacterized protein n=1 Tax=Cellulomonas composti TaxID=266130 RepID=A0A511JDR9_9CELL|nr:hypothetical protein CCO02nite_27950 [Cellulomonas composti]
MCSIGIADVGPPLLYDMARAAVSAHSAEWEVSPRRTGVDDLVPAGGGVSRETGGPRVLGVRAGRCAASSTSGADAEDGARAR